MGFIVRQKTKGTGVNPIVQDGPRASAMRPPQATRPARAQPVGPQITVRKKGPSTLSQVARGTNVARAGLAFARAPGLGTGANLLGAGAPWLTNNPKTLADIQAGVKGYNIGKKMFQIKQAGTTATLGTTGAAPAFLSEAAGGTGMLFPNPEWAGGGGGVAEFGVSKAPTISTTPKAGGSWGKTATSALKALGVGFAAYRAIQSGEKPAYFDAGAAGLAAYVHPGFALGPILGGLAQKWFGGNKTELSTKIRLSTDLNTSSLFNLSLNDSLQWGKQGLAKDDVNSCVKAGIETTRSVLSPYVAIYNMMSPNQQTLFRKKVGKFDITIGAKSGSGRHFGERFKGSLERIPSTIQGKLDPVFEAILTQEQKTDLYRKAQTGQGGLNEQIWPGLIKYKNAPRVDYGRMLSQQQLENYRFKYTTSPFDIPWSNVGKYAEKKYTLSPEAQKQYNALAGKPPVEQFRDLWHERQRYIKHVESLSP